jgi:rubrerythrin
MRAATEGCLRNAFCGESMAHARYMIYSEKADDEGFPSIARLFRAAAISKYLQAEKKYVMAGELLGHHTACVRTHFTFARTMDNLGRSRDAEAEDAKEVYSAFIAVAEAQAEAGALKCLRQSDAICHGLAALLDSAFLGAQRAREEPAIGDIYVCQSCGLVMENAPPELCPVCEGDSAGYVIIE